MPFQTIECDLGEKFVIIAKKEGDAFQVTVTHDNQSIGQATLTTDCVDMECITSIQLDEIHAQHVFSNGRSLAEIVVKFLIKFPSLVRKPEFRFILDAPEFLNPILSRYHFFCKDDEPFYVREKIVLPQGYTKPQDLVLTSEVSEDVLPLLLELLKKNAYWQSHLTLERLRLLVASSQCVLAFKEDKLLGFTRVLSDKKNFASLWDVVVTENARHQGIAKAMMFEIFSDPTYAQLKHWVLFTDTAEGLYSPFGFVKESNVFSKTPMHKLRLQEEHPLYHGKRI